MGYANPSANDRGLPSAMKSRPKIPRTPAGGVEKIDKTERTERTE